MKTSARAGSAAAAIAMAMAQPSLELSKRMWFSPVWKRHSDRGV
jgi:hypothetical protein